MLKKSLFVLGIIGYLYPLSISAQAKPKVWIYTDMSDRNIKGSEKEGSANDPDDISAMAGYLLMCNEFDTKGIVVTSTHRKEHATSPNQADWANQYFGTAYQKDVFNLNKNIGGYPATISFMQSCIKESAERYMPEKKYADLSRYNTVQSLINLAQNTDDSINVLCWGSLTEPAILVNHCLNTNKADVLKKLRFIAHWTNSPLHQGSPEKPENVANCREDAAACAYLKQMASTGKITYYECGAIGQHGIVSGSPKGEAYFNQFKISQLGKIFAEGKFAHNSVDHSDAATYWTLLGNWGVGLKDIKSDGTNTATIEKANEDKYTEWSQRIHDELLRRVKLSLPSPTTDTIWGQKTEKSTEAIKELLQQHKTAVHIMDDWMRDPYITMGPDGYYYMTCTQYTKESENIKMPVYRSADLAKWEFVEFFYSLKDATNYAQFVKNNEEKNKTAAKPDVLKLWAPEMHYINGRWVIVHTSNARLGNLVMAAKSATLQKPITDWGTSFGQNHDPSLFVDTDSSIWLVSRCAEIVKIKSDLSGFEGKPIKINPANRKMGHEGALIKKIGNKYVFFGTAWSTDSLRKGTYNLYYCTSDNLTGPYSERKFAGRFLGHGTPFQDKEGRWWCTAFYNANVPPLSSEAVKTKDLSDNAYTVNKQGLTLVPIDVQIVNGDVVIKALDPVYEKAGSEEVQKF
jgi:hypothetical protein